MNSPDSPQRQDFRRRYPGLTEVELAALFGDEGATRFIWRRHLMRNARQHGDSLATIASHYGVTYYQAQRALVGVGKVPA